jgi:hypothetical protein
MPGILPGANITSKSSALISHVAQTLNSFEEAPQGEKQHHQSFQHAGPNVM